MRAARMLRFPTMILCRFPAVWLSLALLTACAGERAPASVEVERTDSAGVEIVTNRGGDVPLEWRFEEVLRLGGADSGPESFYQIGGDVRTDAGGNLYLLDGGNHRVVVFAADGAYLRSTGSRGGGPGEFERAAAFDVTADGTVLLYDLGKSSLMRWGSEGEVLPSLQLDVPFVMRRRLVPLNGALALVAPGEDAPSGFRAMELVAVDEDERVRLGRVEAPAGDMVQFDGCPVLLARQAILSPDLLWDAAPEGVALATAPPYKIRVVDGAGSVRRIARRDLPVRTATVEDAVAELAEDFRLTYGGDGGGGECRIPRQDYVERMGYADVVPAIRQMITAPDGTLWLNRAVPRGDDTRIDLVGPDGRYLGTLPPDAPYPVAFMPDGDPVVVERDDFDLEYVVVYRVHE